MTIHRTQWDNDWRGIIDQLHGHHLGVQLSMYLDVFSANDIPAPGVYPRRVYRENGVMRIDGTRVATVDDLTVTPSTALFYQVWLTLAKVLETAYRNLEHWAAHSINEAIGLFSARDSYMNHFIEAILTEAPRYQTQTLYNFVLATWYILAEPAMRPEKYPVTILGTLFDMTRYIQYAHRSLMPAEPILTVASSSAFPLEWRRQALSCLLKPRRVAETISEESVLKVCTCIREVVLNDDDPSAQRENCGAMMAYLVKSKVPAELSFDDEFALRTATHCIIKVIVDPATTADIQMLHATIAALLAFVNKVRRASGVFLLDTAMQAVTDMIQRYRLDTDMVRRGAIAALCYEGIWTSRRARHHFRHLDPETQEMWGRIVDTGVVKNMMTRNNEEEEEDPELCAMTSVPMAWPIRLPEAPEDFIVDMETVVRQAAYKGRPINVVTNGDLDMAKFRELNNLQ